MALNQPSPARRTSQRASDGSGTRTTSVSFMTAARLPRDTRTDPVKFGYVVDGPYKASFELMANRAGVSGAVFLERWIEHERANLTDRGLPSWWPEPETNPEELDMSPG